MMPTSRMPDRSIDHPRGAIVYLGERDNRRVRLVLDGPLERRPTELRGIAAAGAVVADRPAEF